MNSYRNSAFRAFSQPRLLCAVVTGRNEVHDIVGCSLFGPL